VRKTKAAAVLATLAVWPANNVLAEVRPSEVARPVDSASDIADRRRTRFELYFTGHFGKLSGLDTLTLAPSLKIAQPVGSNEVVAEWGMGSYQIFDFIDPTAATAKKETLSTFVLGNPHLAWFFAWRVPHRWIRVGLGVAAPAANIRTSDRLDSVVDTAAYAGLWGAHGGRDAWLWAPEAMSVVLHSDIVFRFQTGMTVGVGAHAAELIGIDDYEMVYSDRLTTIVQGDLDVGYEHPWVRLGLLGTYATRVTGDGTQDSKDAIGVTPEVRVRLPRLLDIVARFNLNIDEPFGFSFDDDRYWGATLGVTTATEPRLPQSKTRRRFH